MAPADVALWAPRPAAGRPRARPGVSRLIAIAEAAEAPMRVVERAVALAGRGLEGDRYARGAGTFSDAGARAATT